MDAHGRWLLVLIYLQYLYPFCQSRSHSMLILNLTGLELGGLMTDLANFTSFFSSQRLFHSYVLRLVGRFCRIYAPIITLSNLRAKNKLWRRSRKIQGKIRGSFALKQKGGLLSGV